MTQRLRFTKLHGIGNDFVLIDDLPGSPASGFQSKWAEKLADRRFGVGCDQLLWMKPAQGPGADVRMEILNADGSVAEMCGNGIRAAALYLNRHGKLAGRPRYAIETLAGVKTVSLEGDQVLVDMGVPTLGKGYPKDGERVEVLGQSIQYFDANTGVPHIAIFVPDVSKVELERLGPVLETHSRFPNKTNVNFVQVLSRSEVRVRTWERGAGPTLACGTGACAAAVATLATGQGQGRLGVTLPGGKLQISWEGPGKTVMMQGPAEEVFSGEFRLD